LVLLKEICQDARPHVRHTCTDVVTEFA